MNSKHLRYTIRMLQTHLYESQKSVLRCDSKGKQQLSQLFLTIYVGNLVFLKNSLWLLYHVSVQFLFRPIKQRLLQLTLQHLQETVGVWVVMDATANWNERHKVLEVHFSGPATKSSAAFLWVSPEGGEEFVSLRGFDYLWSKIPHSHP